MRRTLSTPSNFTIMMLNHLRRTRDNYGSEISAAGLNDYDHLDPYGLSYLLKTAFTLNISQLHVSRPHRYRLQS